jgi:hypothetical protein
VWRRGSLGLAAARQEVIAGDTDSESVSDCQSFDYESVTEIRRTKRNSFMHKHIHTENGANVTVGCKWF